MVRKVVPLALAAAALYLAPAAHAQFITGFEGFPLGTTANNGAVMFRQPSFSGSTAAFLEASPNITFISNEQAFAGTQSEKISFQFKAAQTNPWLRLTTSGANALPNPVIDFTIPLHFMLFVPVTTPSFRITLGVRETNSVGPIGSNGGTTGTIEFVGATAVATGGAPTGHLVLPTGTWQEIIFDIPNEPVRAFTGNGVLNGTKGVLENLAFTPLSNTVVGPYTFYFDNFFQGPIVQATPEPSIIAFLGAGLVAGFGWRKRRR